MRGLEDKVAIVAGGGQGMGAAAARRLAHEGSMVVVGDLRMERAESTVNQIVDAGGIAVAQQFDLSDDASVKTLIARALEDFGGVDLLVNVGANVGPTSAIQEDTDAVSVTTEIWEATMRVNLRGYLFTLRYAIPEMIKRGGGSIVSVSSDAAAIPMPQQVAYAVSKAGVEALMRHVASRWARDGIRANSVAPGFIHTPTGNAWIEQFGISAAAINPLGRGGQPDEIGALIAFLLSQECAFINGQSIAVNGGSYMSPQ